MPKAVPPLAQDLIRKLLTVNAELRLGAADLHDLMSHKFFDGIDFATVHDLEPPEKFQLTKLQTIMVKYLPHNVQDTLKKQQKVKIAVDSRSNEGNCDTL